MNKLEPNRRSFLHTIGGLGLSPVLLQGILEGQVAMHPGFVLGAAEGEHLIHFRDHGNVFIKIGGGTGSPQIAMGTQQVMAGSGIPVHRHLKMDEAFYIHRRQRPNPAQRCAASF